MSVRETLSNKSLSKIRMKKTIYRQREFPVTCSAVYSHQTDYCNQKQDDSPQQIDQEQNVETIKSSKKYRQPVLNTVLRQVQQAETLQLHAKEQLRVRDLEKLTPRSKAMVAPKITRKLNFPPGEIIYKNLIPINVNDSVLLPRKSNSVTKKYISELNKVIPPDLCDFLDPLPLLTHIIPEPEILQEFHPTEFNYFDSFLRLYENSY